MSAIVFTVSLIFTVVSTSTISVHLIATTLFLLNSADRLQPCLIYGSLYCNCCHGDSEQYFSVGEIIWFPMLIY